jgi:nitronate monooxygenase
VQLATRFLATHECQLPLKAKQALVDATLDDMVLIKSPVGMPGRALRNKFVEKIMAGEAMPNACFYHCLRTCDPATTPFCIAEALFRAIEGDYDDALVMAGSTAHRIKRILSVHDLVAEIIGETEDHYASS